MRAVSATPSPSASPISARHWLVPLGRAGYLARGLVFALIGIFLLTAAIQARAAEARGLSGTLRALQEQPYGWVLLLTTALGLFCFGACRVAVGWYRRIDAPDVGRVGEQVAGVVKQAVR
jgi:hypothetical protein